MSTDKKIALASCSGMSPYGLIARVSSADAVNENCDTISICMGATAADKEGFRKLIRKYPIIAISGCDGDCTRKILHQKKVKPIKNINVMEELTKEDLIPKDTCRINDEGEICVDFMKKIIKKELEDLQK